MSDGTVIREAVTSVNTIASTSARLIAVMTILDGCTDRGGPARRPPGGEAGR
jgi:hypothetical protein